MTRIQETLAAKLPDSELSALSRLAALIVESRICQDGTQWTELSTHAFFSGIPSLTKELAVHWTQWTPAELVAKKSAAAKVTHSSATITKSQEVDQSILARLPPEIRDMIWKCVLDVNIEHRKTQVVKRALLFDEMLQPSIPRACK